MQNVLGNPENGLPEFQRWEFSCAIQMTHYEAGKSYMKIYIDTDSDLRFARRISRDVLERGRTMESVVNQYINTVKPMYEKFVEPQKNMQI